MGAIKLGAEIKTAIVDLLRYHWALLLFLFAALCATVFSVDCRQSMHVQLSLLPGLIAYVVITTFADTKNRLRIASFALSIIVFFTVVYIAPQVIATRMDNPVAQLKLLGNALFVAPNDILVFSVVAPLALGATWASSWWLRALTAVYLLLMLVISVNMQSRQAVLLLLLGLVIVIALMRPRWAIPALLAGCAFCVVIDGLLDWHLIHKIFLFPRTYVWHAAWTMFTDSPLTGQGPGLFKDIYFTFLAKAGYVLGDLSDRRGMLWAHSLYLEQLAERGILGFIALLSVLGVSIYKVGCLLRGTVSESMRSMLAGVFSALVVFAIAGVAETTLSRIWVTVFLLVLSALSVASVRLSQRNSSGFLD